ncbi:MAG: hypothetical protein V4695_04695 [Pseudomonadota bacterium]
MLLTARKLAYIFTQVTNKFFVLLLNCDAKESGADESLASDSAPDRLTVLVVLR